MSPEHLWLTYDSKRPKVLIVITSKPGNFNQRYVIRETLGMTSMVVSGKVEFIFMLGSLSHESKIQDEIEVLKKLCSDPL